MSHWRHRQTLAESEIVRFKRRGPRNKPIRDELLRSVHNMPLRVPAYDWAAIVTGNKQMFRTYFHWANDRQRPLVPPETRCPRPCLMYAQQSSKPTLRHELKPGILLSHRQEPLGSITEDDLWAEGFETLAGFRYYWKRRYRKLGWRPRDMISVIEVRPIRTEDDELHIAYWALEQLLGEWLD